MFCYCHVFVPWPILAYWSISRFLWRCEYYIATLWIFFLNFYANISGWQQQQH